MFSYTWSGPASGGMWSTAVNWSHGAALTGTPVAGSILDFPATGYPAGISSTDDLSANFSITGMTFEGNTTVYGSATSSIDLGTGGITQTGSNVDLVVWVPLVISGATPINDDSAGIGLHGNVSGTGSFAISGSGQTSLSGDNTYQGGTAVASGGILELYSNTAAGTGLITVDNGANATLMVTIMTVANDWSVAGAGVGGTTGAISGNGADDLTGPVTLTGNTTFNEATSGSTIDFAGGITGAFGVTFTDGPYVLPVSDGQTTTDITSGGSVAALNSDSFGSGAVTVTTGSEIGLGAGVDVANNLSINGTGVVVKQQGI